MIATTPPPTAPPITAPLPDPLFGVADGLGREDGAYTLNCSGRSMNAGTRSPSLHVAAGVFPHGSDLQHLFSDC
jgi:hypothetical protein